MGFSLGIIVSDDITNCRIFAANKKVGKGFSMATTLRQLHKADPDIPVIITRCTAGLPAEMMRLIWRKFKSVRYIDY